MSVISGIWAAETGRESAEDATVAQKEAEQRAIDYQYDALDTSRADFRPFQQPSGRALASLQSAIYGGPFTYDDPNYQYDAKLNKWVGPGGARTDAPPKLSASFTPQESESYKWQKSRGLEDLGRSLRMLGRSNSTAGMNARSEFLGNLNAAESERAKQELWNLVKTGQGAAGTISGSGSNAANTLSNIALQTGAGVAGNALSSGMARSNLYGGLSSNAVGSGLRLYDYGRSAGWWGGGGGTGAVAGAAGSGYGFATSPEATESLWSAAMYA